MTSTSLEGLLSLTQMNHLQFNLREAKEIVHYGDGESLGNHLAITTTLFNL